MKLKLVLGDTTKTFNIGSSKHASEAIQYYAMYLLSQEHSQVSTMNQALFEVLDTTTSQRRKSDICTLFAEHALYKLRTEECPYKRFYFVNVADSACTRSHVVLPEFLPIFRQAQHELALQMQNNFDIERAKDAGIAIMATEKPVPEKSSYDAELVAAKNLDERPIIETGKFEALSRYTHKFFDRHPPSGAIKWRTYTTTKLPEELRRHDVRYVKLSEGDSGLAQQFSKKLKKHGFTATLQPHQGKIFLSTDLTAAKPVFKN